MLFFGLIVVWVIWECLTSPTVTYWKALAPLTDDELGAHGYRRAPDGRIVKPPMAIPACVGNSSPLLRPKGPAPIR